MAYVDEYALFADETNDLHKKVARGLDKAARDIINEDPGTENHVNRIRWAKGIRKNPDTVIGEAHRAMVYILDNATVAAAGNAATDNDVQYVVNGIVDTLAEGAPA